MRKIILHVAACILLSGCRKTVSTSAHIVCRSEYPLSSLLFAHTSPVQVIIVDGKRFEGVHAIVGKYYYDVPDLKSILFVLDDHKASGAMDGVTFHVIDISSHKDIAIKADYTFLGTPENKENVSVDSNKDILLSSEQSGTNSGGVFARHVEKCRLDLVHLSKVDEKDEWYDKDGKPLQK